MYLTATASRAKIARISSCNRHSILTVCFPTMKIYSQGIYSLLIIQFNRAFLCCADLTHLNHNLQVEVNLKKFNVPVEFGLMSGTKYADYTLDHQANLYLHSSKDRTQYTYHIYFNKRESGKKTM
jgi:hypothetical protein